MRKINFKTPYHHTTKIKSKQKWLALHDLLLFGLKRYTFCHEDDSFCFVNKCKMLNTKKFTNHNFLISTHKSIVAQSVFCSEDIFSPKIICLTWKKEKNYAYNWTGFYGCFFIIHFRCFVFRLNCFSFANYISNMK